MPIHAIRPKVSKKPCQKVFAPAIREQTNRIAVKSSTPKLLVRITFLDL